MKIRVETLGCAGNRTDGQRLLALFAQAGWKEAASPEEADLLVLQTCGFTQQQEEVNLVRLAQLNAMKKEGARVVVGGCLPAIHPEAVARLHAGPTFGPRTIDRFARQFLGRRLPTVPAVAPSREERGVATVRVATGCMDRCTYCAIPFANGRIRSRTIAEIAEDVRHAHSLGYVASHLVAEDIGAWGQERGQSLLDLVRALVDLDVPMRYQIDNLNPNWVLPQLEPLLEVLGHERVVRRFYIPAQSGSDSVLQRMERRYTVADVREVFGTFRTSLPGGTYSSDFIVGFPGEDEEDFQATRTLMSELDLDFASVYKFEDRPRIAAAHFPSKIQEDVKERRARLLIADLTARHAERIGVSSLDDLHRVLASGATLPINTNALSLPQGGAP